MSSAPPSRKPSAVGVGLILLRDDGNILLGHRIRENAPSWCLPGGHVEAGESFEAAALRELSEEAGIDGVHEANVFGIALDQHEGAVRVTAGVVARARDVMARCLEPDVFDRWIWASSNNLPKPLFRASEALLAVWRGEPLAAGWTWYAISPVPSAPVGAR